MSKGNPKWGLSGRGMKRQPLIRFIARARTVIKRPKLTLIWTGEYARVLVLTLTHILTLTLTFTFTVKLNRIRILCSLDTACALIAKPKFKIINDLWPKLMKDVIFGYLEHFCCLYSLWQVASGMWHVASANIMSGVFLPSFPSVQLWFIYGCPAD